MKFVFCLLSERGHINPFIGVAQVLQAMNHEAVIASSGDFTEQMQKSALPFVNDLRPKNPPPPMRGREFIELVETVPLRPLFEEAFIKPISSQVEPLKDLLSREKPDAVVIDPMNYAIIAAQSMNLRWIGVSTSLTSVLPDDFKSDVRDAVESLAEVRGKIFTHFGSVPRFRAADALSPFLNISFSTKDFIGAIPADVEAVGPSRPLKSRGDEKPLRPLPSGKPVIYVSFGSQAYYQPEIYKKIIQAVRNLPIHLVMSVGDLMDDLDLQETPNCDLYEYAPQLEILRHASLFVTHGGANSVSESLAARVPMLVHPICNEQIHQAYFVQQSGVGHPLNLKQATTDEIATAFMNALEDKNIRERVRQISKSYQTNGAINAARLIAEAAKRSLI